MKIDLNNKTKIKKIGKIVPGKWIKKNFDFFIIDLSNPTAFLYVLDKLGYTLESYGNLKEIYK